MDNDQEIPEIHVLMVEDDETDAQFVMRSLATSKHPIFHVEHVTHLAEMNKRLDDDLPVDVIILDLGLPDSDGISSVMPLLDSERRLPVIVFTGQEVDDSLVDILLSIGVQDYIVKGKETTEGLRRCVRYSVERHKLLERIREQREEYEQIIASLGTDQLDTTSVVVNDELKG